MTIVPNLKISSKKTLETNLDEIDKSVLKVTTKFKYHPSIVIKQSIKNLKLTISRQRPLSHRNQSDWFLYDNSLRLERVNLKLNILMKI